jgi:hypothetical protein
MDSEPFSFLLLESISSSEIIFFRNQCRAWRSVDSSEVHQMEAVAVGCVAVVSRNLIIDIRCSCMMRYLYIMSADYRKFCDKAWGIMFRKETVNLFVKEIDDFNEGFHAM